MNWQEYYRARTIPADEAAAMVKAGMRVDFPFASGTVMQRALAARGKNLDGVVDLRMSSPLIDAGWLGGDVARAVPGRVRAVHRQRWAAGARPAAGNLPAEFIFDQLQGA